MAGIREGESVGRSLRDEPLTLMSYMKPLKGGSLSVAKAKT